MKTENKHAHEHTLDSVVDVLVEVWHIISEVEEQVHRSQDHSTVAVLQTLIKNILKVNKNSILQHNVCIRYQNGYFVNHNNSQEELSNNSDFISNH